ncbi:MAG: septum formation protein Maf [Verrucomicrobia bacterium]|nr:MAG: septum formation protein Maf [Verrucomicrobiota bacterium]
MEEGTKSNLPPLILASASPRRSELLQHLGVPFQVVLGIVAEVQPEHLTPHETGQINAYRKARVVAKKFPDAVVLGADTLVCLGTRLFGKPLDRADAQRMLEVLQGHEHEVITGVCLIHLRMHRQKTFAVSTRVTLRKLRAEDIHNYLGKIDPCDKAGAYAIQEHGDMIVENVDGSYTNVVGLPIERLKQELEAWNRE